MTQDNLEVTCTCACHESEENHHPDECYCIRYKLIICPECKNEVEPHEDYLIQVDEKTGERIATVHRNCLVTKRRTSDCLIK